MPHALRMNFENFGHTTKNKIFRLVKLLADLCTRLKCEIHFLVANDIRNYRMGHFKIPFAVGIDTLKKKKRLHPKTTQHQKSNDTH